MTRAEIQKSLERHTKGAACIGLKELCDWLGVANQTRVKKKYLNDLEYVSGKKYFIPEVAKNIWERR